jgi:hypothetical protein
MEDTFMEGLDFEEWLEEELLEMEVHIRIKRSFWNWYLLLWSLSKFSSFSSFFSIVVLYVCIDTLLIHVIEIHG